MTPQLPISRRDLHKLLILGGAAVAFPAFPQSRKSSREPAGPIRLHFNENPAGLSPTARGALNDGLFARAWQYPDEPLRALQADLMQLHGIEQRQVILGNGSSELLAVAAQTFGGPDRPIVVASPTYDAVAQYADGIGAKVHRVPLTAAFAHDLDRMTEAVGKQGLLYICNPNNPTGTITPGDRVREVIGSVPADVLVIVDEAYHHYVEAGDYQTMIGQVASHPNLLVLRTFSKIYAMAGLRCGYGIAQADLIARLRQRQARNNMNVAALLAATGSLVDAAWVEESKKRNARTRSLLFAELGRLGFEVTPSEASFFMVRLDRDSRQVASKLAEQGILVGRQFPPMNDYLRISIGTQQQMERFVELFAKTMGAATSR